jgi:hypothetical protein
MLHIFTGFISCIYAVILSCTLFTWHNNILSFKTTILESPRIYAEGLLSIIALSVVFITHRCLLSLHLEHTWAAKYVLANCSVQNSKAAATSLTTSGVELIKLNCCIPREDERFASSEVKPGWPIRIVSICKRILQHAPLSVQALRSLVDLSYQFHRPCYVRSQTTTGEIPSLIGNISVSSRAHLLGHANNHKCGTACVGFFLRWWIIQWFDRSSLWLRNRSKVIVPKSRRL